MGYLVEGDKCKLLLGRSEDDDLNYELVRPHLIAQTFTLTEAHVIRIARLKAWTRSNLGKLNISIQATDADGKPDGIKIDETPWYADGIEYYSPGKWHRCEFGDWPQIGPGIFAIVIERPDGDFWVPINLRAKSEKASYFAGETYESDDGGATWTGVVNQCLLFEVWGWVPPPDPPPDPAIGNWAVLDFYYNSILEGFSLVVETDRPCHLYMRWTDTEPLKHASSKWRRGISLMAGTRYCFVTFHENEQEEAGDTLIHTFIKKNWPVCQTRWFYFIGSVVGVEQPSSSPIFHLHREAEYEPFIFGPKACTGANRTIQAVSTDWDEVHDAPAGNVGPWHGAPTFYIVSGARHPLRFWIERGFLFFDTTDIPKESLILGAVLSIHLRHKILTSTPAFPHIYITIGAQHNPVIPTDYGRQLPYTDVGGEVDINDLVLDGYNHIILNDLGLTWIKKNGQTRLCIRQEMDVIDHSPPLGDNQIAFSSVQAGDELAPYLTVYYVPPDGAPPDWFWHEPWSEELEENNPWEYNLPLDGIDYALADSKIRLFNPSMDGAGIRNTFTPTTVPLINANGKHLTFKSVSDGPEPLTHDAYIVVFIWTTDGVQRYLLEMIISRGDWWGPWGSQQWGGALTGGIDYGLNPGPIDLASFWAWAREKAGLDADPTGWYIDYLAVLFEAVEYEPDPYLINDDIGLTYE